MANSNPASGIATRLRWAREQSGLSQGQVALAMKMHRPTISQIESGDRRVQVDEVERFASLYDVSRDWLVDGDSVLQGQKDARIAVAARELGKLKDEDLDALLRLIQVLRDNGGKD